MNVDLNDPVELKKYLDRIDRIFNIGKFLEQDFDSQNVVDYYRQSSLGYRLFHSSRGSIHMALNEDGKFNRKGLQQFLSCETQPER